MSTKTITSVFASLLLASGTGLALAEDIDIYSKDPNVTGNAPNVLIVLDSSSNWSQSFAGSTKFAAEKAALAQVVGALKAQFNLGIMMYTETGKGNSNIDGGYMRFAIQPMTDSSGNATPARNCLLKMVGAGTACTLPDSTYYTDLGINADKGNGGKIGITMAEVYDYFAGTDGYAGINKAKADFTRVFTSRSIAGPQYKPPVSTSSCQKNYVIVINNGNFADNQSDTTKATTQLSAAGGSTAVINPPDNGSSNNNEADEWTRWLHDSAVQAVTYTLEVGPQTNGQGPYNTALLQSMGREGKGGYYSAIDAATLLSGLTSIFNDILGKNSVFASPSLPLGTNTSGALADQVYLGVFRPDSKGLPRWVGNLKQYKLVLDGTNLVLVDAASVNAATDDEELAQHGAVSFWTGKDTSKAPDAAYAAATGSTTGSTGGFWHFDSKGVGGSYDSPDGEWVEKGGAAQKLRLAHLGYGNRGGIGDTNASTLNSLPARQVYTCTGTPCPAGTVLASVPFDSTNAALTAAAFGTTAAALPTLLRWIRGQDTQDENGFKVNGADTDVRASIHGDVLHSRAVVLNYGATGTTNSIYAFYGGNDGVFRAIKGGRAATDGNEQWAFIAQEFFGRFLRLYTNSPQVLYPSTPAGITPTPTRRDYFWDGPVGSYVERNSSGAISKAYLYIAVRRGGRFVYALDVTSPTNPKILWTKSSADFPELGETWSQPQVVRIRKTLGGSNTNNIALILGAGYDAASEDPEPPAMTDSMGRGIFVLDAFTGSLVWWAGHSAHSPTLSVPGMDFGIAADILPVDRNFDGLFDRLYAADVGGNVWRVDIDDASTSNWKVWKIAAVASRDSTPKARKFLFGPDAVLGVGTNTFDAVVIGSGDREHPLASNGANGVADRVYMFADTATGMVGKDLGITDTCGATVGSCSNLHDATINSAVPADAKGWSISLAAGEKVINSPLVVASSMIFGTHQPNTSSVSCTGNLGTARRYSVDILTGVGTLGGSGTGVRSGEVPGGGFLASSIVIGNKDHDAGESTTWLTDVPLKTDGIKPSVIKTPTKRFRTHWRDLLE